ncbi:tetraacyldisaccharide 4'-kinase [Allofranklinella schreckenbergeri]|uniref:Tetraacyldisaccharide 4'-kinase n=1 Tax=Allofranklinella schreckenbergeri TaxID=1076744 RepID=A0A3M6QVF4_9BURK|nr:tetraacyldisaccharide 4'-kinase [Allofranklinella schreckenbergeri]RMX06996.1 tetraacyldisaccharide 4'-kinase [Allofranklinella schreckenbergeri]
MLRRWLEGHWRQPAPGWRLVDILLRPLAFLYGGIVKLRRWLYVNGFFESRALPVPVVVVGNVVVGGAGKTPLIIALAQDLMRRGIHVGVVARGYGRSSLKCLEVRLGRTAAEVGDEPLLIHLRTQAPTFVARSRWEAGNALLSAYPSTEIIICDDGLQHLALRRDVQLCVFPPWGVGNARLLPAGPLRESLQGAWANTIDIVVQSVEGNVQSLNQLIQAPVWEIRRNLSDIAHNALGQVIDLTTLAVQDSPPICAIAGIANPESFFSMLRARGLILRSAIALKDHYDFAVDGVPKELDGCSEDVVVLCTEKDAVKLWLVMPAAFAVPLEISLLPAQVDCLLELVNRRCAEG